MITIRNESYSLNQIKQQQQSETTPIDHTYPQATDPNYDTVLLTESETYNRLQHTPPQSTKPSPTRDQLDNNNTNETHLYSVLTDKDELTTSNEK